MDTSLSQGTPVAGSGDILTPGSKGGCAHSDFASALHRELRTFVADGLPSVELAAEIAGTSVRTLQRRLRTVGLSYSELLEQIRREAAFRMVRNPEVKLIDVAMELGFSDPAHFTRAFRRWAGMPPSQYRREYLEFGTLAETG